jgi:septal ring factor EnvC (AmiA/AmiB activator)
MKLSKTTWGLIGAGCFLVAAVIIFNMWNTAVASRDTARLNLETSRKLYSAAVTQKANLNTQIAQIEITIKQGQEQVAKLQTDFNQAEKELQQAKIQSVSIGFC